MLQLFDNEEENKFSWGSIGDVNEGRSNLGSDMPVFVYRLMQYTIRDVLSKRYGNDEMIAVFRDAGELAGKELANQLLDLT
ncbi:MAG: 4-vinyl reductase, partial [Angelakisella sp.]